MFYVPFINSSVILELPGMNHNCSFKHRIKCCSRSQHTVPLVRIETATPRVQDPLRSFMPADNFVSMCHQTVRLHFNCQPSKKQVSMIRKCHNHRPRTIPMQCEEETQKTDSNQSENFGSIRKSSLGCM